MRGIFRELLHIPRNERNYSQGRADFESPDSDRFQRCHGSGIAQRVFIGSTKVSWSLWKIAAPIVSLNKGSASPWLPRIKISGYVKLQLFQTQWTNFGTENLKARLAISQNGDGKKYLTTFIVGDKKQPFPKHCISNISMWWSRIILGYWDIDPSNDQCKRLRLDDIDGILKSHSRQWPRQVQGFRGFKSTRIMP